MSRQDRTTLRSFFRDGALPSAENYGDLIDSSVNQFEDGFDKTVAEGVKIVSLGSSSRIMSLYQSLGTREPSWVVEHGESYRAGMPVRDLLTGPDGSLDLAVLALFPPEEVLPSDPVTRGDVASFLTATPGVARVTVSPSAAAGLYDLVVVPEAGWETARLSRRCGRGSPGNLLNRDIGLRAEIGRTRADHIGHSAAALDACGWSTLPM